MNVEQEYRTLLNRWLRVSESRKIDKNRRYSCAVSTQLSLHFDYTEQRNFGVEIDIWNVTLKRSRAIIEENEQANSFRMINVRFCRQLSWKAKINEECRQFSRREHASVNCDAKRITYWALELKKIDWSLLNYGTKQAIRSLESRFKRVLKNKHIATTWSFELWENQGGTKNS